MAASLMVTMPVGAGSWASLPQVPPPRAARPSRWPGIVARIVILVGAAVGMEAGDDVRRALAMRMLAIALTIVAVASYRVARFLDLPFTWAWCALRWAAWWCGAVLLEVVFALPARTVGMVLRREPIGWRRLDLRSTWVAREPIDGGAWSDGGAALAGSSSGRGLVGTLLRPVAMVLVLLLGVDAIAGAVVAGVSDGPPGGSSFSLALASPPMEPGTGPATADNRVASPAFASSPWADAYFREFHAQGYEGVPFVQRRYRDRSGTYLNVEGNVRRTVAADHGPVVWFFGGSTMFGEGQRDAHTIPSEVARLATEDGHPIQAVNFGVQGDSDFQSVLRLEAALASDRPHPDLIVFYDGANDVSQHVSQPATDQPQTYQGPGGPSSPDQNGSLLDAWRRTSLVARVVIGSGGAEQAALPAPPETIVDQIVSVYGRGQALARALAAEHGVAYASFFQPARLYDSLPWVEHVRARLPEGTVDLADAHDGPGAATFFDAVHTNEEGAQIVAEAIYGHLDDQIAQLDR